MMDTTQDDRNQNASTASLVTLNGGTDYQTVTVAGQRLGIPVEQIADILAEQTMTPVFGAPAAVKGLINLRGRIVTAIDLRIRLDAAEPLAPDQVMHVVVERNEELYSFAVDRVDEIRNLEDRHKEHTPGILDTRWQAMSHGVFRIDDGKNGTALMLVADVDALLDINQVRERQPEDTANAA